MTVTNDLAAASPIDDHSSTFGRIRQSLHDADDRTYRSVREQLKPRWWVVWTDLGATWLALAAVIALLWAMPSTWPWWSRLLLAIVGSVPIGVLVHRIGLFLHEGAHVNVAPAAHNDLVTNIAAGAIVLTDVRAYRPIHMAHHRNLGTTRDTERTYFERLDLPFLVRAASGVHVLQVIRHRSATASDAAEGDEPQARPSLLVPLLGVAGHATLIVTALVVGAWPVAIGWVLGLGSMYPLVQSTRQLLEHRAPEASGDLDYRTVDHGAFTRMFDRAAMGPVLGGAGFNRHLLHHWDAKVSYTRLAELERWLEQTDAEPLITARRSSYVRAVRRLWGR